MKRIENVKHPGGLNTHTHTHTHVCVLYRKTRKEATDVVSFSFLKKGGVNL